MTNTVVQNLHLLKLVTRVDISTRPVNKTGREGNAKNRINRSAEAAPKTISFRRSITIIKIGDRTAPERRSVDQVAPKLSLMNDALALWRSGAKTGCG